VVLEEPSGIVDLDSLTREVGGAMPGFLAAEYARTVASVLRMAHQLGGVHGDVRPANLLVGPLTVKTGPNGIDHRRPAPDAIIRLAELGFVPLRPPAVQWAHDVSSYLRPERVDGTAFEPRVDLYGLGATLYFLLTGGPPFMAADTEELLNLIRSAKPAPLSELRPDLPPQLAGLVERMMEKSPERRPAAAFDVESALIPFCRPGAIPPQQIPQVVSMSPAGAEVPEAEAVPDTGIAPPAEDSDGWGVDAAPFAITNSAAPETQRRRETTHSDRARTRLLLVLGGLLHLTGVALVVAWALGAFKSDPVEEPAPSPSNQDEPARVPKKVRTVPSSE
jgi:serine/threonine protein kinase